MNETAMALTGGCPQQGAQHQGGPGGSCAKQPIQILQGRAAS